MKVALTYRVLQHWRTPVFRRLANWPGIEFIAFHGSDFPGTKTVNGKNLQGFRHRELPTIKFTFARGDTVIPKPLCPTLPFHLAQEKPDVILAEGGSKLFNNFFVFAYAWITRTPLVWWTLGEVRGRPAVSLAQKVFRAISRRMERASTALLGYSSVALDYFERQGYSAGSQFRAVNCVDTDRVFEEIRNLGDLPSQVRKKYELEGKRVLLFVGALTSEKRLEDLIAVYPRLKERHDDLRLMIVGAGPHRETLEQYAESRGAEGIIFTGEVISDVAAYFQVGDVFVLPGLGGLAISEAMAHGLPVIATLADGCEVDLVEEGKNGYRLPPGDQKKLEVTLDHLLSQPELLESMKTRSRWIIENRFNINTYMENLVAALEYATTAR